MTDLTDATTNEIFKELKKRNDAVIIACWQFLGADRRCSCYTNWQGPRVLLAGLLKEVERELELRWQLERGIVVEEEDDDDD